jgi:thiol-disulfide isomerase/thioredoxin
MVDTAILVDTTTPKTTFGELFAEAHQDRAVFLFVGKHCPACDSLKPLVTELVSSGAIDSGQTMLQVLVVVQNESREASGVGPSWEDFILTAKRGGEFARQLPVRGTPAAILIGDTGEVLSPLTLGTSSVAEFLGTMFPTHSDPGRVPA